MGAREWSRDQFETRVNLTVKEAPIVDWFYDSALWRHLANPAPEEAAT